MKTLFILITLFSAGCLNTQAQEIKTQVVGTFSGINFSCRYMSPSQFSCGADLHECIVNGRPVQRIVCASNVMVFY